MRSLHELVQRVIKPKMEPSEIAAALLDREPNRAATEAFVREYLSNFLPVDDDVEVDLAFGVHASEPVIRETSELSIVEVSDAFNTSTESVVASLILSAQCDIEFFADLVDIYSNEESFDFSWAEWNETVALAEYSGAFRIEGQLTFDMQGDRITVVNFELTSIERELDDWPAVSAVADASGVLAREDI